MNIEYTNSRYSTCENIGWDVYILFREGREQGTGFVAKLALTQGAMLSPVRLCFGPSELFRCSVMTFLWSKQKASLTHIRQGT